MNTSDDVINKQTFSKWLSFIIWWDLYVLQFLPTASFAKLDLYFDPFCIISVFCVRVRINSIQKSVGAWTQPSIKGIDVIFESGLTEIRLVHLVDHWEACFQMICICDLFKPIITFETLASLAYSKLIRDSTKVLHFFSPLSESTENLGQKRFYPAVRE